MHASEKHKCKHLHPTKHDSQLTTLHVLVYEKDVNHTHIAHSKNIWTRILQKYFFTAKVFGFEFCDEQTLSGFRLQGWVMCTVEDVFHVSSVLPWV